MNTLTTTPANGIDRTPPTPSLKPVADAVAQETAHLGDMAKHLWEQSADRARQTVQTVRGEALAANERTRDYVRAEPMKSMLMAAAAGAVLTGLFALLSKRH